MKHDPICPWPLCDYGSPSGNCMGYDDCVHHCQCHLIALVRADERRQAVQRIANTPLFSYEPNSPMLIIRGEAIAAARGDGEQE